MTYWPGDRLDMVAIYCLHDQRDLLCKLSTENFSLRLYVQKIPIIQTKNNAWHELQGNTFQILYYEIIYVDLNWIWNNINISRTHLPTTADLSCTPDCPVCIGLSQTD